MKLDLTRKWFTDTSTIGELHVDGTFECFSLEDKVRPEKIFGETAIPAGTYAINITRSERFKRLLPLLVDVPNFEGVRIHNGNTDKNTEGCILVGRTRATDFIGESVLALNALLPKLQAASDRGEAIAITIVEDPQT